MSKRRGSNPSCEICNQLSDNDLEKFKNCPLAFWECVEDSDCPIVSRVDAELLVLVNRWPDLTESIRVAIAALINEV